MINELPAFYFQNAKSTDSFVSDQVIPPHPEEFPEEIEKLESHYFALGEVSNVWKCQLKTTGRIVAVKAIRGISSDINVRHKFEQQLEKLVKQWEKLCHPNVMPCFGLTMQLGPVPALIFPMCPDGSIVKFVETHPEKSRIDLLVQVTAGVNYLHSHGVIHADLRGSNILIATGDTPQIMDAGLSQVISRADFTTASPCGPCRWMPPEILDVSDDRDYDIVDFDTPPNDVSLFTESSDVYSLGMTILEVITGKVPFHHRRYDTIVIVDVIRGVRPPRPDDVKSDGLWDLLKSCWQALPTDRPTAKCAELWLDLLRWTDEIHSLYQL